MPSLGPDSLDILRFIRQAPLTFGPWRDLKTLYKRLEAEPNSSRDDVLALLIARFDQAPMTRVFDVPTVRLGEVSGGRVTQIALRGQRALLVTSDWNSATLRLADFATPDRLKPRRGGALKTSTQADWSEVVFVGEARAAIRAGDKQIQIVDLGDFDKPRLRGVVGGAPLANLQSIAGGDPFVFAACGRASGGLRVVGGADPDAPTIIGTLPVPGATKVVVVPGSSLVALLSKGPVPDSSILSTLLSQVGVARSRRDARLLHLIDVPSPTSPRLVSSLEIDHADQLVASEQFLYVSVGNRNRGGNGVRVVDINDPRSPRPRGTVVVNAYYHIEQMALHKGYLYVAPQYGAVQVIDVRDPDRPVTGRTLSLSYISAMACDANTLFLWPYGGLTLWHLGDGPDSPMAYGMPPSAATLGYLKRRARRHLRNLAQSNPERFVAMAARVLGEANTPSLLDPAHHWISVDLIFGGGGRFEQTSHGRGHYKELRPRGLSLRRREERFPNLWDAHPNHAAALLSAPRATWEAREMALKALRAARQHPLPDLPNDALNQSLAAPSLLLIACAVRQTVARLEAGNTLPPDSAAAALAKAAPLNA